MPNRQFFTMKFNSSRLKEFGYNISLTYDDAKLFNEIIALSDNQILRSIRDITNHKVDLTKLEEWYKTRDNLRKQRNSNENIEKIKEYNKKIVDMMFVPEYVSVVIEHEKHYDYLFNNGFTVNLNGKEIKYLRFSCSAGQARVSTVIFCDASIIEKLSLLLNNNRNGEKLLTPSKLNSYFGLSGSATHIVSTPKFCVVPDYVNKIKVKVNYVTETSENEDDLIEEKEIEQEFNRTDGMGLIDISRAKLWAKELGLLSEDETEGYIPAQWCIRQNFIKGMLCTFPIHEFCEKKNNKNYNIKSIYKDKDGNDVIINLQDYDVILSESQFKLWDSFESLEQYKQNCIQNNLFWGVSLYTPKEPDNILKMNYQFLQTLNLNDTDIKNVCDRFVRWIEGVNYDDIDYTLLFLLGENNTKESIQSFLKNSDNYWIKCLVVNNELKNDKYIRDKIYNLIQKRIKNGCLGDILVDGNFQVIVSDPYAFMQHVCGLEVTGLLKKNEYYCGYWNKKGVTVVDGMRSPLTYRSEHVKMQLKNNEQLDYWFRYIKNGGFVLNYYGEETMHFGGSDFDFDILATTSSQTIIKGIYEDEFPVYYVPPKPEKKLVTPYDLYLADKFSFGSKIGAITNKGASAYALLGEIEEMYSIHSPQYKTLINRLRMSCKLQSAQIDKAKIGREVKGIPKIWVERQIINQDDSQEIKNHKEFINSILLNRHPYFFIYLYKDTKQKYKKHFKQYDRTCHQKFKIGLKDLINKHRKTKDERDFISLYEKFNPIIDSKSVMNNLCKYIESIDFKIKEHLKSVENSNIYLQYTNNQIAWNDNTYLEVLKEYKKCKSEFSSIRNLANNDYENGDKKEEIQKTIINLIDVFKQRMDNKCSNVYELVNYLVKIFYVDFKSSNKDLLWNAYGKYLFNNIKSKSNKKIYFPFPNDYGDIEYLGYKYKKEEVEID